MTFDLGLLRSALARASLFAACLGMQAEMAHAEKGWSEALRASPVQLGGAKRVYSEEFDADLSMNGPILWAKVHADVGQEKFDPPGGYAYLVKDGLLSIRAYRDARGIHSGNVQSTNAAQAYQGEKIVPGKRGFVCTACYFEARIRFPAKAGTWGAFWLLSPDNPKRRGHLEVDGIEYYGKDDPRGHHHAIHRWQPDAIPKHVMFNDYTGMNGIADGQWHSYGMDLRGQGQLNGKKAIVIYFDGGEVGRIAADPDYFSTPFYFLMTLQINPRSKAPDLPQAVDFDYVRVWK